MARLASVLPTKQRLTVLGGLFVVAGSAVAYGDTGYPFLGIAFAALLGLSAMAALVLALPLAFRPAGRAAVFAIGATYFLDVAYFGGGPVPGTATVLLAAYLTYLIAWRGNTTVISFATTAIAVSTVFILPQQVLNNRHLAPESLALAKSEAGAKGRPYVHIILDEMSPLDMMPEGPFYDALKRRMSEDYRRRGFDLFQDTKASAGETIVSVGEIFAGHDGETHNYRVTDDAFTYSVNENRTAGRLADAGYAITMLQNNYLQICNPDRWRCLTYARSGDGAALSRRADDPLTATSYALRATGLRLLINDSVRSSVYFQALAGLSRLLGVVPPSWPRDFARPPLTAALMEEVVPALGDLRDGEAVFLHLLLPHYPYLLDEECRVKAPDQLLAPRWVARHVGLEFDAAATERAYWEQAACTHDRLMAMIDAILGSPGGRNAVILVHGDHGSRLFEKFIGESASENERRHTLLAHFAVRGLDGKHDELAARHTLRERVSIVLNAVLDEPAPDPDLVTSATH